MDAYRLCAALLAPALASSAWAARPFVTDDARVVEPGHCQVETFYKEQRAYPASEYWLLPACNPSFISREHGAELTFGRNRIEGERNTIVQAKLLFRELKPNGYGLAGSVGSFGSHAYVNGIASFSLRDDRAVLHTNLGAFAGTGPTGGIGLEALVRPPKLYGILETYGQRGEKPALHYGVRYWVVPNRFQIDATRGDQRGAEPGAEAPRRRFYTVGLRVIF